MISVLIVDDEKIVRKGLASFMPWEEFGMKVIGEANNGENALKFLESNTVDLMFTDLAMPVMSGIELMRIVTTTYPHIQIVVLTLHQDFDYIQEALRLGAIDYIAKTELEKEQFEDILSRIASLLDMKKIRQLSQPSMEDQVASSIYVAYPLHPSIELGQDVPGGADGGVEIEAGVWYWSYCPEPIIESFAYFCIEGIHGMERKELFRLIRNYNRNGLFYDYNPTVPLQTISIEDLHERLDYEVEVDISAIKQSWLESDWIFDDKLFEKRIAELSAIQLPAIRLMRLFFSLTDEWNRMYNNVLEEELVMEDHFLTFVQFSHWLKHTRQQLRDSSEKPQFSIEIQSSITRAKTLALQNYKNAVTAAEMAKHVNMSLSYFSQCFKQIVGKTYTDYIRDVRMEHAKNYLVHTSKTIQWIAEEVGYNDEKYFSRLFKEFVGVLPSDYRLGHRPDRLRKK